MPPSAPTEEGDEYCVVRLYAILGSYAVLIPVYTADFVINRLISLILRQGRIWGVCDVETMYRTRLAGVIEVVFSRRRDYVEHDACTFEARP